MMMLLSIEGFNFNKFAIKRCLVSGIVAINISPCFADYLDGIDGKNEVSKTVPSREIVIKMPEEDLKTTDGKDIKQVESFDEVLKLIPSYKYFKIIAKEYSSRSSSYKEGDENMMAPFM